jgi:hypothetical protein
MRKEGGARWPQGSEGKGPRACTRSSASLQVALARACSRLSLRLSRAVARSARKCESTAGRLSKTLRQKVQSFLFTQPLPAASQNRSAARSQ